jgi:putative transposase
MARPLRVDLPGAIQHVTNRGNDRQDIFRGDADKALFMELFVEEADRCGWLIHDYALMDNHFHLLVETPEANLSRGMQRLQTRYVQRFNRNHGRTGHLFGGRFGSQIVEGGGYLMEVARYIALNPVRAGMVERPEDYRWTSYRAKAGLEAPPPWLSMSGLFHFERDIELARKPYVEFVMAGVGVTEDPPFLKKLCYGSESFVNRVQEWIDSETRSTEHPRYQRDIGRPPVGAIKAAVCAVTGRTPEELRTRRGDVARLVFAEIGYWEGLRTLQDIAQELGLRSAAHVSSLVRRCREQRRRDPALQKIVDDCLELARQKAPPLPEHYLSRVPI